MKALRTLVVEDDAIIGALLAETLEGLGHTVCAVERNVANAVSATRSAPWRGMSPTRWPPLRITARI